MILASHNSWSYAPPQKWYLWPVRFMAKCQNKDIRMQFYSRVRMFDLRVYFSPAGNILVKHGWMTFKVSENKLFDDLSFLDTKVITTGPIYVRVMLEQNIEEEDKMQNYQEDNFKEFCKKLEYSFGNLLFIGGTRKFDEKKVYNFSDPTPVVIHKYSSTTSMFGNNKNKWYAKLDDLWPWIYATTHNATSYANYIDSPNFLMLDFI
jgi:hypothetical protein